MSKPDWMIVTRSTGRNISTATRSRYATSISSFLLTFLLLLICHYHPMWCSHTA